MIFHEISKGLKKAKNYPYFQQVIFVLKNLVPKVRISKIWLCINGSVCVSGFFLIFFHSTIQRECSWNTPFEFQIWKINDLCNFFFILKFKGSVPGTLPLNLRYEKSMIFAIFFHSTIQRECSRNTPFEFEIWFSNKCFRFESEISKNVCIHNFQKLTCIYCDVSINFIGYHFVKFWEK